MTTKNASLVEAARELLTPNYRMQPVAMVRGEGCYVWDAEGRRYLDMLGGIATVALGHCHPKVVAAAKAQLDRLWHISNLYVTEPQLELARRLIRASGMARAFFCNSGAEANEALIKLARKAQKDRGHPERFEVITAEHSFHGRTLATLAATGQTKYQHGFEPMPEGFRHVPYGDASALAESITEKTAAVLLEPIQGEGGVRVPPAGYFAEVRRVCDQRGVLLLLDEVQTGMGRTGRLFGFENEGIHPDAFSLAKALANGLPMGAMLCSATLANVLGPGTHASTFGGNPVAAAAACAVFDALTGDGVLDNCRARGEQLRRELREATRDAGKVVVEVRGAGLLVGVEMTLEAAKVVGRCREAGMLVNAAGERVVRFAPPLVVVAEQVSEAVRLFAEAVRAEMAK
jgi:acetylornithine/N-succinyldiaminopimelate aminotransferase